MNTLIKAKHVSDWRKKFTEPITEGEFKTLQFISNKIDELFEEHYKLQKQINEKTQTKVKVWGQPGYGQTEIFSYTDKEDTARKREETNAPYYKLKTIMDYWCSLWFWDVRDAEHLPTREEYISDILNILDIDIEKALEEEKKKKETAENEVDVFAPAYEQTKLGFAEDEQLRLKGYKTSEEKSKISDVIGKFTERTTLFENKRIPLIKKYTEQYRFFHYELEFVEVFKERGGFDVIVGNPPWVKITFEEKDVIAEKSPEILIKNFTAPQIRLFAEKLLEVKALAEIYKTVYIESENQSVYSNALQNFPLLIGQQGNLYKLIISVSFQIISQKGFIGLLHPETVYDDPNGAILRVEIYKRLLFHFQFINELLLFSEIDHHLKFSINIYSGFCSNIDFISINNIFHPSTLHNSFIHDGRDILEGFKIKDDRTGKYVWNLQPHKDRIIKFTSEELKVLSNLFESDGINYGIKLVNVQSSKIIQVLKKISVFTKRVRDYENIITVALDETNDVNSGIIIRKTSQPIYNKYELILSGPHFHVANPIYKTPRKECNFNLDYDIVNHLLIDDGFLQRTNYIPNITNDEFVKIIKGFVIGYDDDERPIYDSWIEYYKVAFSKMISSNTERTLQPAIVLPKISHTNGVITVVFKNPSLLIEFAGLSASIILDFLIKTIGTANLTKSRLESLPFGIHAKYKDELFIRTLRLNCLNKHYNKIWESAFSDSILKD